MRTEKLQSVSVFENENQSEYYEVGKNDVTAIEWGEVCGHMAMIDTVRVFKNGAIYSEHPFTSCLGVCFEKEPGNDE